MQVYATDALRNVVFLSHGGAGKTSLAEAMLVGTGAITRMGKVEEGNTVTDYEPEEIESRHSVQLALAPVEYKGVKLNVIDAPGYADFMGEVLSALAAADSAVILVSAVDGVQVGTEIAWRLAGEMKLPRFIVISKMDRENADFSRVIDAIHSRLGKSAVPLNLPIGSQASFKGVLSVMDAANADKDPRFSEFHEQLMETAAEAEDELTEKYLDKGELTAEELAKGIKSGVAKGLLTPVLSLSATQQHGVKDLLEALVAYAPAPTVRPAVQAKDARGKDVALTPKSDGALAAFVFKTTADPYVGKLSLVKVLSGTLKSDMHVWNAAKGHEERVGQLHLLRGKHEENVPALNAGDIGAVAKLVHTATSDTLSAREHPFQAPPVHFPGPAFSVAIAPKTKADMDKMSAALGRLVEEDPSLHVTREQGTGETLLSGLGDAHIDVAAKRLKRKFGVEVITSVPKVPFKETIKARTSSEFKHKKQSGGHGQYGHVVLELEPLPRGKGLQFEVKVVGGSVPKEYFPAVEKGVHEAVHQGVLSGNQVVDLKVTLTDGSYHAVDSSGMAFQIAAVQAVKQGLQQAHPVILEPVMTLKVTVPDSTAGVVMGDLNGKRARVSGMTPDGSVTTIEAQAPLSELRRYATELRSLTQGRGIYSMEFAHYEEMPAHLAQKVTAEMQAAKAAA